MHIFSCSRASSTHAEGLFVSERTVLFFVIPDIPIGKYCSETDRLLLEGLFVSERTVLARAGPALAHYWKVSWVSLTRLGLICVRSHCNFASRPTRAKVSWPAFLCQCEHSIR